MFRLRQKTLKLKIIRFKIRQIRKMYFKNKEIKIQNENFHAISRCFPSDLGPPYIFNIVRGGVREGLVGEEVIYWSHHEVEGGISRPIR